MTTIYHNPRCSKSRESLKILETSGEAINIIKYLEIPLKSDELKKIIKLLKIKPIELIRQNEKIWKESFKNQDFEDEELIEIMIKNPQLIERPIVIKGDKAIIGRPPIKILDIL